ncbi:MAG: TIGR00266 family protein [Microcystaceae cyanobacterium]
METAILQQPDSSIVRLLLDTNEEITVQAGAMISMSNGAEVNTTMRRGSQKKGKDEITPVIGGDSLFLTTFKATTDHCEIILSPTLLGDLLVYELTKYKLVVQSTAFLACPSAVDLFVGFRGFKAFLDKESLFWLSVTGKGKVILQSFGAIYEVMVDGDYMVDMAHLVAFENSLDFTISKLNKGGLGTFFHKEKQVCRFHGQGKVFCQTHNAYRLGQLLGKNLNQSGI